MKKLSTTIVACALALAIPMSAFAADANEVMLISPQHETQATVAQKELKIETKVINKVTMLPARTVFEALGFNVKWNGKEKSIHADNGEQATDFVLGKDLYSAYSVKMIGMTAPVSFGAAPVKLNGSVYVPVQLFNMVLGNKEVVVVKDGKVMINNEQADSNTDLDDSVQIPNPFHTYDTLDEARKALDVQFAVPSELPNGYVLDEVSVLKDSKVAQVIYKNEDNLLFYRVAQGNEDISGDYNVYETTKTANVGQLKVTLKGNKGQFTNATWQANGFSYSILSDATFTLEQMTALIHSIK